MSRCGRVTTTSTSISRTHAVYLRCKHIPHGQQRVKLSLLCRTMHPLDRLAEVAVNSAKAVFIAEPLMMSITTTIAMATGVATGKRLGDACWDAQATALAPSTVSI